ncbi:MAG: hypothetical protein LBL43_05295 [Treponema sp.]|jgi:hypothetical protein|nr:hypothetical protein [Treponema sp.]
MNKRCGKNGSLFFALLFLLFALMENQFLGMAGKYAPPARFSAFAENGGDYAGEPVRENHEFFAAAPWAVRWSVVTTQEDIVSSRIHTIHHPLSCSFFSSERSAGKGGTGNIIPLTLRI